MFDTKIEEIPSSVEMLIGRTPDDDRPVVVMTCGLAGSGKTTFAKAMQSHFPSFERLSIDEIIFKHHGLYGVDYPANNEIYQSYQEEADAVYLREFQTLLQSRKNIILDRSFYAKEDRDEFYCLIQSHGARRVLVYFKAIDKEVLWQRICARSAKQKDANSALDISRGTFDTYWSGFEEPIREDEVVLNVL
ncbi:AAA domain-containing protein [Truncatella angustata]|uniref:AAA domain-containing protein n=1 Tax=Truncatella angustata TaxID=152316 RepID=A0A9P8UTM2_9PEZI|nr:AAA domain-containing protein [Truncatella angustata]KAH6657961.1 AAA domain-containing protein [Truncatella angustata]KAH8198803.1 hypothetical protein TruAng_007026 [Truncatella angustata]